MLCNNCGKEISESADFCKYCGTKVEKPAFGVNINPGNMENAGTLEDGSMLNIFGCKIKGRLIIKIAAIIVIACFFFPMFTVSCAGVKVMDVSMGDIFAGVDDSEDTDYYDDYGYYSGTEDKESDEDAGVSGMVVYLIAPIIILVFCRKKNSKMSCEVDSAAIFIASALMLIIQFVYMKGELADEYGLIQITPMFTYYLYMISCAVGAFAGIKTGLNRTAAHIEDESMRKPVKGILLVKSILISLGGTFAMFAIFYLINDLF